MSAKQMWQAATALPVMSLAAMSLTTMSLTTMSLAEMSLAATALPSSPARRLSRLPGRWRG